MAFSGKEKIMATLSDKLFKGMIQPVIHNFTRVKNTEYNKEGLVDEFLSKQFTVNYEDGTFGFLFYADKGDTWHPLDEKKKKSTRDSQMTRQGVRFDTLSKYSSGIILGEMKASPSQMLWTTFDEAETLASTVVQEPLSEEHQAEVFGTVWNGNKWVQP